jgi:aconitate hydratase 2/2-methylisocitrate dehydratase
MLLRLKNRIPMKRNFSTFIKELKFSINERKSQKINPKILNYNEVKKLCEEIKIETDEIKKDFLLNQFENRISPGVDDTSKLKASFLNSICKGDIKIDLIDKKHAIKLLGTMQGGYNIEPLINMLDDEKLGYNAYKELSKMTLIFDYFYDVEKKSENNKYAKKLLNSWANAEWFLSNPAVPEKITVTVFKVTGETNTDDLSPAQDAWSRPDIPLHSLSMLKNEREGIIPDIPGEIGPINKINQLKDYGFPVAYVGDVVGTGSSRKSATNSILWFFGNDIEYVPNKKNGGYCIGNKIAPIFFNTMEDSGALPIEMPVDNLNMGDIIDIYPYKGITTKHNSAEIICKWELKSPVLLDSIRAKGRINLIIGKSLTKKARETLNMPPIEIFSENRNIKSYDIGFTLAQKIVGKACGLKEGEGILPGSYCEPTVSTVGSQDTTGPMTRDELKDLACLGFTSDLVMQSFCHTAAYPKPIDVVTHSTLPKFINNRGGISLKPGDGIIHSWLNRMLLPDTVGTGGDSHTRFPIGISFPAGSGLVAFSAATGVMPLDMPESVLVKFTGELQPGITLRDLVHSIPYYAIKKGLLTTDKKNKKNVFSGRILEIEGLSDLTCEQAFELSDASAERSAAGCTIKLNKKSIEEYLKSNISLLEWMINEGYQDKRAIERRIKKMEDWLENPKLMEADEDALYYEELEINMDEIIEPILCAPNDPDDARLLSEVMGHKVDEVFIGSCMTNIGHFRAAGKLLENFEGQLPTKLWIAPPTKMDEKKLIEEGFYSIYGKTGARTEMPGCSLCMGNQARVNDNSTVLSTSTRNFPNRLGKGANVYLASAELSAITAIEGKIPDLNTYLKYFEKIDKNRKDIFNYMSFDKLEEYKK